MEKRIKQNKNGGHDLKYSMISEILENNPRIDECGLVQFDGIRIPRLLI